jgi:alpha 1,3-glucosidase
MILSHWLAALALVGGPLQALAAKHHDFKECHQQSFCRRLRGIAERADNTGFRSPYTLDAPITTKGKDAASWTFPLHTSLYEDIQFELQLDFLQKGDGIARVRVDEVGSKLPWKRYDEAAKWALVESEPTLVSMKNVTQKTSKNGKLTTFTYGPELSLSLEVQHDPFHITFKQGQETVMTINDRNLFHMEHFREKESKQEVIEGGEGDAQVVLGSAEKKDTTWFEGEPDKDMFQETWSKWTDSKPKGTSNRDSLAKSSSHVSAFSHNDRSRRIRGRYLLPWS